MSFGVDSFGLGSFGAPVDVAGGGSSATLTIQDVAQSQTLESFSLSANGASDLSIQSIAQAQAIDNVTLSVIPSVNYRVVPTGDSNASGRGSYNQTNSATAAYLYDNAGNVVALADPYDGGASQTYSVLDDGVSPGGSYVQHLADLLDAAGKSVMVIPANKGGTQSSSWTATTAGTEYAALKNRVNAAGGDGSDLIFLIHLGANDADSSVAQATFKSRIETFVGNLNADFPLARKYLQKVHHFSGAPGGAVDTIRAGVDDVWNGSSGCLRGADLDGITTNIHYGATGVPGTCTSELNEVALRTFNAVFGADLVVADITQAQTIDVPAPAAGYTLTVADLAQGHTIDALGLSAEATLSIADLLQASHIDNVALYDDTSVNLQVADLAQGQTIDAIALSSAAWLSIFDIAQASQISHLALTLPGEAMSIHQRFIIKPPPRRFVATGRG